MFNPQPSTSGAAVCMPTTLAPAQYTGTGGPEIVEAMPWQIGVNRCDRPSPV